MPATSDPPERFSSTYEPLPAHLWPSAPAPVFIGTDRGWASWRERRAHAMGQLAHDQRRAERQRRTAR